MRAILFFKITILGVIMGILIFTQLAWAEGLEPGMEKSEFIQTPHIQKALAELAQTGSGGKGRACFQTGSMEKCAACCKEILDACIAMVIPLCHQGDPNRAEFRHCIKGKEDRCKSDFSNCAWLCRRTK